MQTRRDQRRPFDPGVSLRDATAQELQLELLRRTQHDALDGERVVESLLANRHLWIGVILDRPYVWENTRRNLPLGTMVKLRDLQHDDWNADTLYVLCRGRKAVEELKQIAEQHWAGEVRVFDDRKELSHSLGSSEEDYFVLSVWWD